MRMGFERSLGFLSVFSISVGAMISGLFVLPGLAAAKTGPSVILAFFLAGLIALPAAGPLDQRDVHLKIIASIARLTWSTNLLNSLREAKSSSELVEAITTLDREEPL